MRAVRTTDIAAASVTDAVLRITDLRLRRGARPILVGVSLAIEPGALVAIMGPSGSGKTTVLRVIAGLERFDAGQVAVDGVTLQGGGPIPAPTLRQLRRSSLRYCLAHWSCCRNY